MHAAPPELEQVIGGYRLVRQIAAGAMTRVYEAVNATIGGRAAVKVLIDDKPEVIERFLSEAKSANVVRHANVVRIIDFGRGEAGLPYLAMEYLDGETLRQRLARQVRLPVEEILRLGRQIASGLAAAHEAQVVHRDLKPDNVMIVKDDETVAGERAIILDFGLARLSELRGGLGKTRTNMVLGTASFSTTNLAHAPTARGRSASMNNWNGFVNTYS